MHVGTQGNARTDTDLEILAQLGVNHICQDPPGNWRDWTVDLLERHRDRVASFGISLDMVQLPLSSAEIDTPNRQGEARHIMLANEPERDRELDEVCQLIEKCARAGIPAAKYNLNIIGIPRSERETGRGGASSSTFRWSKVDQDAASTSAGDVSEDEFWERINHFLGRVVPVAESNKVRLACHPHDPYTPPGYRGVTRVLGTVEGLKKFVSMHESPYHGLNFCQGTVSEMLDDPGEEICDVIRYFGERKKIFNVHFRNIRGRKLDFMEVFPDEGSVDMVMALKAYQETGYEYMLMPDHVPEISGPDARHAAFAYCYGYIRALLQAIGELHD